MDWSAIQILSRRVPSTGPGGLRTNDAIEFLKGPNFIPAQSEPARIEFDCDEPMSHFRFATPRPSEFAENNVVYGQLYRCANSWRKQPAVVLLHGWNSGLSYRFRFPWTAERCNRAGYNAAFLVLPYNFRRSPRQASGGFDCLRIAERTSQAVAEIRALCGWLLDQGCPAVALWGSSYGGWLAGLTACHDRRLAAAVMAVPGVRSNRSRADLVQWPRVRKAMLAHHMALQELNALSLLSHTPVIPKENILLIEAIHDLLSPRVAIEELWQRWGRPVIWLLPHGHFSFSLIGAPRLMTNQVLNWLAPRLDKSSSRKNPPQPLTDEARAARGEPQEE